MRGLRCWAHALLMLGLLVAGTARADEVLASVSSPGRVLTVTVQLTGEGRLAYRVERRGQPVIAPSRLGLLLANAHQLDGGFKLAGQETRDHDETWEQPWGESARVRNRYRELRVDLQQPAQGGRRMSLRFRLYDDGLGFRYELPEQAQLPIARISDELTEFDIAEPATAWWNPAGEALVLEYPVQRSPLAEVGLANTPLTMRTRSGLHLALHEAALVDYATMWVRKVQGQKLRAQLAPSSRGAPVEKRGTFTTPWRSLQIADTAAGLYESSNLILNLNEPNRLCDVSWVQPGKFVGVWWAMHLDRESWSSGPRHGATTANTKTHIDFAARHGFRGVLVEGWNLGWDGNWVGSQSAFDYLQAMPDFDLGAVSAYAKSKGVRLIGHHETGGNVARYESQMNAAYALYAKLGVDTVKSGYVTDAGTAQFASPGGGTHFGFTESQEGVNHFLHAVQQAARYKIAIDTHEPVKDTGLRRTYPNWVSREGARGQEFNAWGDPINPVDHEVNLLFTRMLSGPMDYTPGILSLQGAKGKAIHSTQAKQLALFVALYSPVVMVPDLIEHYERYPAAFQFIKDVPTDWQTTRVIHGELGEFATLARKDRRSEDWYVGAITNGEGRSLPLPLDFLDPGRRYRAEIYRDGEAADYRSERRFDLLVEQRIVRATDTLPLRLAPGGGQAIRLTPCATENCTR